MTIKNAGLDGHGVGAWALDAQGQALGQAGREMLLKNFALGQLDVVFKTVKFYRLRGAVINGAGGPGIPVPRLPDRAGIDQVGHILLELDLFEIALDEGAPDAVIVQGVEEGKMSVAEKAQARFQAGKSLGRVELAEYIIVLVEGRAVAQGDVIAHPDRTGFHLAQEMLIGLGDGLPGPVDGRGGHGVEIVQGLGSADRLVVVSPDDCQRLILLDEMDDFVGRGAVAHQVAQEQVMVDRFFFNKPGQRLEGFQVAVNIGENQVALGCIPWTASSPPCMRRA